MAIFDDLFENHFFFDNDYRQRRDIMRLQEQINHTPSHAPQVWANTKRVDQLELLCNAVVELLVAKGLATPAELRVLMQQLDLTDGIEDGRMSQTVQASSPRCTHCQRFVNPSREACVYCGTPLARAVPEAAAPQAAPAPKPRADVTCAGCSRSVPESDTYFTGRGLMCASCFAENPE